MQQLRQNEQRNSKRMFESYQKDYVSYLRSLLPQAFLDRQDRSHMYMSKQSGHSLTSLNFFTSTKSPSRHNRSLSRSRITQTDNKKPNSQLGQFLSKLVKSISRYKSIQQNGQLEIITKQLGIDIKQLNKIDNSEQKVEYMLNAIDNQIEEMKKKMLGSKSLTASQSATNFANQKQGGFVLSANNFTNNSQIEEKQCSKYEQFLKEQNKKDIDNFAWLEINTKYPMLEKKLKAKLIQTINEDKNERRIRDLIQKKENNRIKPTMNSTFSYFSNGTRKDSSRQRTSMKKSTKLLRRPTIPDIDDQKVQLINQQLFMQQYQKAKIQYTWTDNDQKMFLKNIQQAQSKCSSKGQFLKLCGRFKFISQKQFQTLACEDISRMLNKNNKIYLSREFLLDKYYSTTEILSEQQMKFILKTSPMLSKCVDKGFIKMAIKNIKYENISELELKIAEDIINRFEKLRDTVRNSRKVYKQQINQVAKQRIAEFEKNQQFQVAKQIAREQLKNHKVHLMRALNYKSNNSQTSTKKSVGLSKKSTKNIWNPLNRYHPSTGLFVKDCNEQCTDDIYNPYEKEYLKSIDQKTTVPKRNILSRAEMIKFYTGGPDQNIQTTFQASQNDVKNICSVIKAFFYEKKILASLQPVDRCTKDVFSLKRNDNQKSANDLRKKNLARSAELEMEMMAKKKLFQNRQKAKQTVYVNKLLSLAAENSYLALKSLNPHFTPEQVNRKDKKGNTALYYACRFMNQEFIEFLMRFGANPNIKCQKQFTPLHVGFRSNNINIILQLLTSPQYSPNLNILNSEFKTPLAYCSRQVLRKLCLQQGVTYADPNIPPVAFDNNMLLEKEDFNKIKEEPLELEDEFALRINQNKGGFNRSTNSATASSKIVNY